MNENKLFTSLESLHESVNKVGERVNSVEKKVSAINERCPLIKEKVDRLNTFIEGPSGVQRRVTKVEEKQKIIIRVLQGAWGLLVAIAGSFVTVAIYFFRK